MNQKKMFFALLMSLSLSLCTACSQSSSPPSLEPSASLSPEQQKEASLEVDFLDVGQGLSVLVSSEGHYMLYDGGDREYSSFVVAYLKEKGIEKLDYVVASHYDSDHLNGVVGALNAFDVDRILGPDYVWDSKVYQSFITASENLGIPVEHPEPGAVFSLGGASFQVLAPSSEKYGDSNNYSIVLRLTCGKDSFLFTGDAEYESEEEMCRTGLTLDSTVLCVGHHGSASSSTYQFLEKVLPEYAVISCGAYNSYGHPHEETMEKIMAMEIPFFRTDIQGTITATSEGNGITWNTEPCKDYSSGDDREAGSSSPTFDSSEIKKQESGSYVLNTNTKKVHLPDCSSAEDIKESNKEIYTGDLEQLIENGFSPCQRCLPRK